MASSTTPIADSDRLGYRAYSDALWQRIELALNKDAKGGPLGDDPLVVGIFGEWGAGKSQLLKILFERAQQQTAREIAARSAQFDPAVPFTVTVPVFFQPWKYEHEAHLHVPIAVHIADALDDAWKAMPTDFEKVKHYAAALTDKAESAVALVEKAEGVFKKITGLLSGTKKALSSDAAKLVAGVGDTMLATAFVPPFLSAGRLAAEKALKLTDDESVGNEDKASGSTAADKAIAKATTEKTSADKIDAAKAKAAQQRLAAFQHSDNGLGFYRVHKLLADLTRPKLRKDALVKAGMKIAKEIEFDLRINFVVFIDDLDRCLPEKAVQTLEIIKTVFNAESFAFVLALDEEVIERGIGHRYKEYELVGKKPQMPISGFEYLEKIVHLPFRLPALTLAQAHAFVRGYEASIEPDAAKRWFDEPSPLSAASSSPSSPEGKAVAKPDLLNLALSAFDAYVPRKLIRLVELVHQVSRVQATVGGGSWLHSQIASGKLDQRVVLVMLMLQLFQPELYRLMRRKVGVLPGLMAAFSSSSVIGKMDELQELDTADLSDSDLWRWAIYGASWMTKFFNASDTPSHFYQSAFNEVAKAFPSAPAESNYAQQLRLPLVALLVEHRAAQRHVFDALKLIRNAVMSMEQLNTGHDAAGLDFKPYLSALVQPQPLPAMTSSAATGVAAVSEAGDVAAVFVTVTDPRDQIGSDKASDTAALRSFPLYDIKTMVSDLLSERADVQANIAGNHKLQEGAFIEQRSLESLVQMIGPSGLPKVQQIRLLQGLQHLAPYLAAGEGEPLWNLVKDCVNLFEDTPPKLRALWGDVRAALGCDPRFDPTAFYLPKKNFKDEATGMDTTGDTIPGFVRVNAIDKQFLWGEDATKPNARLPDEQADFYLARYPTTVAQFLAFVNARDFDGNDYWLTTSKEHGPKGNWATQLQKQMAYPCRPVVNVNWWVAIAYTRWLQVRLREGRSSWCEPHPKLFCSLPTEGQWECAARWLAESSGGANGTDTRVYPWGNMPDVIVQRANISASGKGEGTESVGCASAVGLYPHGRSMLGLADMAGNVLDWMRNGNEKYDPNESPSWLPSGDTKDPSLRGGAWLNPAELARTSIRNWYPLSYWNSFVGFRVVLSLPK